MQELAKALSDHAAKFTDDEPGDPWRELDHAAVAWSTHALRTYDGKLLLRALAISKALAEFTAQLNRKKS